ncbi:MAG: cytochrome P450 [Armatimonadetes bacterium]|nr:cytochrome P450 [Armatimonadota bacterium]
MQSPSPSPLLPLSPSAPKAPGPPDYYLLKNLRRAARDPVGFYTRGWKSYGDIVRFHWRGPFSAYLCVHPHMVERVLQANWTNYPKGFFYKRLSIFTGNGLFTSAGELWLKQRRLAQPAFHRAKIAGLAGVMAQTVGEMLDDWDAHPTKEPFDLAEEMMRLALQIAGRALFGTDLKGEAREFHHLMNVSMLHIERRFNPLTLPESVPTPQNRRFLKAKRELDAWILGVATQRRQNGEKHDDLLQMLLDARDEETGEAMSDRQLADEVLTLLVAGHETTADALAWGFSLLARNPEARDELESEAKVLNGAAPEFDDLARLPYAKMVFEEAMRLYPPIWALSREAKEDDVIGGYLVPARSTVMVLPFLTHRHPDFWDEPERFDPQRFTPEKVAARPKFAYFPFGGGPRLCLGQSFAWMEGQIALAMIASRYRLELAPNQTLEMHPSLALRPKGGLWMTRRRI